MARTKVTEIPDAGYDWFAPSGQGEAVMTPELLQLAGEILDRYDNESGDAPQHTAASPGYFRRILGDLGGRGDESVCVVLPVKPGRG
jgi:hypothetical protein